MEKIQGKRTWKALALVAVLVLLAAPVVAQRGSVRSKVGKVVKLVTAAKDTTDSALTAYAEALTAALDTLAEADSMAYRSVCDYAEQVFDNPASAKRSEERFVLLLRHQLSSPASDVAMRSRAADRLHLLMANRPGTVATDLSMMLADGSETRLHEMQAPLTLLFINDPDCLNCRQTVRKLQQSETFTRAVESGRLSVVALATMTDEAQWRGSLGEMPPQWKAAFDKWELVAGGRDYDISSLPSLYLLDGEHRVLLRHCTTKQLLDYLRQP